MSVPACEQGDELDEVCEFLDDEPLVATVAVPPQWWNQPDPAAEAKARAIMEARAKAVQAPIQQVECCICLTAQDIKNFATYVPCGHCAVCADCYMKQWHLAVAEDNLIFCPKCRAVVTDTLKVFV